MNGAGGSYRAGFHDGVLEITLHGEIDHHNAVRVRGEIDGLICEYRPRKTVLDLKEIEFMDSSGLGLIMGRYALMQRLKGELTLRDPNPRVVQIFSLAGLERMIRIETEERREQANESESN